MHRPLPLQEGAGFRVHADEQTFRRKEPVAPPLAHLSASKPVVLPPIVSAGMQEGPAWPGKAGRGRAGQGKTSQANLGEARLGCSSQARPGQARPSQGRQQAKAGSKQANWPAKIR